MFVQVDEAVDSFSELEQTFQQLSQATHNRYTSAQNDFRQLQSQQNGASAKLKTSQDMMQVCSRLL